MSSQAVQDYTKAIYALSGGQGNATTGALAQRLGVIARETASTS